MKTPLLHARFICGMMYASLLTCGAQTYLGNFTGYSIEGKATTVHADTSSVRFIFFTPEIVRVDFLPGPATVLDSSLVVIQDTTADVATSIEETDSSIAITSASMKIVCGKNPLRIAYCDGAGKLLLTEPASGGLATNQAARIAAFTLNQDDHFYGTGERGTSMDRRGQAFDSYNTQIGGYTSALPTMNTNIPFITTTGGYALYFENTFPGRFDFGVGDASQFSYTAGGGELSYFVLVAPTVADQLERYTWLTGRQPLPPRWAFGFLQSKFGYQSQTEATSIVQTMRQEQIPCDAIILDLYWYQAMGDLAWNTSAWPQPFTMMSDFLAQGIKTIVITEPYIVQTSINFSEASSNAYLAKNTINQPYLLNNWWSCGCNAGLLDITNPAVQTWWWSKHPGFFGTELSGIWTDLGEPENHPLDMLHYLGSAAKVHNIFNLLWAKTVFNGFHQFRPNQRLFNLTRSGYAGIQRYGVIPWSGDVGKSFGGLAVQPPMMLGMGMSGLAYHNSDIGGFCCGTTTPELYVRWMQYGTFCPITRAHGTGQPTEPWGYGAQAESLCTKFIQLRYQLLPYIYTMAYENYQTGLPLARPLFFADANDNNLTNESSSYFWGDAFLVSPVVQVGQTSKLVYLPRGTWIDFWTDNVYQGGSMISVPAPLDKMPLFVRAGSIIPLQPLMNYSDERPLDTLILRMYPVAGPQNTFSLYEDDGKTLDYQSGKSAQTRVTQSIAELTDSTGKIPVLDVLIGASQGVYDGRPTQRVYLVDVHGISRKPTAVSINDQLAPERLSIDELRQNGNGFYYDQSSQRLYVHVPTVPDSSYHMVAQNIQTTTSVENLKGPLEFRLEQNYPNPFNPVTTVSFVIGSSSFVTLGVYDVLGKKVATLVNEVKQPGKFTVKWDASDAGLPSGVYFYRLTAGTFVETKKLILVK
ncbi:MAG: TIM-barrel domain-containing protein [Bacteroidota bacterium]|jgi:alpha-glucosidase (family GH31 glycosyl hydrolase)